MHSATKHKWFSNGLRSTTILKCWLGLQVSQTLPSYSTVTNIWLDRARYQGASSEDRAVLVLKEAPKQYQACFAWSAYLFLYCTLPSALTIHCIALSLTLSSVYSLVTHMHITQQCDRWNLLDKDACTFFQPTVHISRCIGMHMKGVSHATHDVEEEGPLWCHITLLFCSYVFKEKTTYTQTWRRTIFTCPFFFSSKGTGLDVERNIQG